MGCRNAELFLTASTDGTNRTEQRQQVTEFKNALFLVDLFKHLIFSAEDH